jgi:3-methylcrotonyl-CoA carboxylase beta subunit
LVDALATLGRRQMRVLFVQPPEGAQDITRFSFSFGKTEDGLDDNEILNCNQAKLPIIFLHDVNGFMVGRDSEQAGIIRRGAKMVNAVANSVVPKISVILGGSYGAGHYAMAGKAYAPRFIFAWPSARYSVMGGQQAAKTILDIQAAQLKRAGKPPDDETLQELYEQIRADYDRALDIKYAAARLWIDEIILPLETRGRLIRALEACAQNPHMAELKVGVFQV